MPYRVTVDTGGTFSDFVYLNEETDEVTVAKLPSTPDDPSRAILAGVEVLLARGVKPDDIFYFCHGTTVGTNALLEGKGVRAGLLVTQGLPRHLRGGRAMPPARLGDLRHFLRPPAAARARKPDRRSGRARVGSGRGAAAAGRDGAARHHPRAARPGREIRRGVSAVLIPEARARGTRARHHRGGDARRRGVALVRYRAADPRILPALDDGD